MHVRRVLLLVAAVVGSLSIAIATDAGAASVGTEIWIGGGFSFPDYSDDVRACARGGLGVIFMDHVTLGISGQADREHFYYFGDTSVVGPALGLIEPYGRFQVGRRDDTGDTAMAWAAGLRMGDGMLYFFLEASDIFEPESDFGICGGISLWNR